jgi:hypothetical protein
MLLPTINVEEAKKGNGDEGKQTWASRMRFFTHTTWSCRFRFCQIFIPNVIRAARPNPRRKIKITKRTHFNFQTINCPSAPCAKSRPLRPKKRTHYPISVSTCHFPSHCNSASSVPVQAYSSLFGGSASRVHPDGCWMLVVSLSPFPRSAFRAPRWPKYQLPSPRSLIAYWAFPEMPARKTASISCARVSVGGHKNIENNPVFRGMLCSGGL